MPQDAPQRRRVTRAEARRSRLKKRIWTFLIILLLVGVGIYVSVTLLFKIGKYEIQGECLYTLEEMTEAFGHAQGENIFSFSLSDAEKQIAQKLPYLESIKVRRRLPDTIVFIVEPAKESYCAAGAGGFVVLSEQFKILRTADQAPLELCLIDGINAKSTVAGTAFQAENEEQQALLEELLPALEESGISGIGQIDLTDSYALSFTVNGGNIRVLLGTTVKLDYKLKTVYKMLTDELAPDSRGTLDVTAAPSTGKTIFKQDVTK
ncbi:MAG: FtsQ-type POTRA domain-containing protein [Oscillospiraceae bacterium]|nr:FtsQ-type POTRA domain-containing protein [Oscillospiraceae bacterium]